MKNLNNREYKNLQRLIEDESINTIVFDTISPVERLLIVNNDLVDNFIKTYTDTPKKYGEYLLLYNRNIANKRLEDRDYIISEINNISILHNTVEFFTELYSKYNIVKDKNIIIDKISKFNQSYIVCKKIYEDILLHFKNKRQDYIVEYDEIVKIITNIFKQYEYESETLLEKIESMYYSAKEIPLTSYKTFKDLDGYIIDNRQITAYEICKSFMIDNKLDIEDKHIKEAKKRYSIIYFRVITDNIFEDKEKVLIKHRENIIKSMPTRLNRLYKKKEEYIQLIEELKNINNDLLEEINTLSKVKEDIRDNKTISVKKTQITKNNKLIDKYIKEGKIRKKVEKKPKVYRRVSELENIEVPNNETSMDLL